MPGYFFNKFMQFILFGNENSGSFNEQVILIFHKTE